MLSASRAHHAPPASGRRGTRRGVRLPRKRLHPLLQQSASGETGQTAFSKNVIVSAVFKCIVIVSAVFKCVVIVSAVCKCVVIVSAVFECRDCFGCV